MATNTFGRVRLTFTSGPLAGQEWNVRGEVKIQGHGGSVTTQANTNGSISKAFEPKPVMMDVSFERRRIPLTQTQFLAEHGVIVEEVDFGRTHFATACHMEGDPEESTKSGDLTGIKFAMAHADYRAA